jgi:hypothetical protein
MTSDRGGRDRSAGGRVQVIGDVEAAEPGDQREARCQPQHRRESLHEQGSRRAGGDEHREREQIPQALHGNEDRQRQEHEECHVDQQRRDPERPGRTAVEPHRQQRSVERP